MKQKTKQVLSLIRKSYGESYFDKHNLDYHIRYLNQLNSQQFKRLIERIEKSRPQVMSLCILSGMANKPYDDLPNFQQYGLDPYDYRLYDDSWMVL